MSLLTEFCLQQGITAGVVQGIGAAEFVRCGYYSLPSQEYQFTDIDELVEILSFSGNVALKDGGPFIHAHGVFGRADTSTFGGHVAELRVGVTFEVILQPWEKSLHRAYNDTIGLHLLDLGAEK